MKQKQLEFQFMKEIPVQSECLYRFIGQCKGCEYDFNPEHHPNNLDCTRYRPIGIAYVKRIEQNDTTRR